MIEVTANKAAKFRKNLDVVLRAAFVLDDLADDPREWSEEEAQLARQAILTLGAPESFLRRFARSDIPNNA